MKTFIKGIGLVFLSIGKSIWRSSLSVLYLIVYSYLLFALINYYGVNELTIQSFLELIKTLSNNWNVFWWIFFLSNMYSEWEYPLKGVLYNNDASSEESEVNK